ncbi:MAG: 30S ribosomal protein S18 [Patescibacteria group bacterium]
MTAGRSKKSCIFTAEKFGYIDYKNTEILRYFISRHGRVIPRYYSGVSLKYQKQVARAIKRAREMGLLPYLR